MRGGDGSSAAATGWMGKEGGGRQQVGCDGRRERDLEGKYKGEKFALTLFVTLKKLNLTKSMVAITKDNASNNTTLVKQAEELISGKFQASNHLLGCMAHVISLAACDSLDAYVLDKTSIENEVPVNLINLQNLVDPPDGLGVNLKTVISHIHGLSNGNWIIRSSRRRNYLFCARLENKKYCLSTIEWDKAKQMKEFLKPLHKVTEILCRSNDPTLNFVITIYMSLIKNIIKVNSAYNSSQLIMPAKKMVEKLKNHDTRCYSQTHKSNFDMLRRIMNLSLTTLTLIFLQTTKNNPEISKSKGTPRHQSEIEADVCFQNGNLKVLALLTEAISIFGCNGQVLPGDSSYQCSIRTGFLCMQVDHWHSKIQLG
ncbi:uncharacterized protein VP01_1695g3 [Puccinia sorghi]|uniref:Uncharacterized protein n=1 Tax=Puccinia sorghi TaxID=27349 RepID=A0A0L6VHM2_9BASI|nr:uncharacterized protein VP01_1695g3 [Puccinia sorghi]